MEREFSQPGVYAHGIVTFVLSEYYAMTKDERVVDLLKQAVGYIVDGQGPDGGWPILSGKSARGELQRATTLQDLPDRRFSETKTPCERRTE